MAISCPLCEVPKSIRHTYPEQSCGEQRVGENRNQQPGGRIPVEGGLKKGATRHQRHYPQRADEKELLYADGHSQKGNRHYDTKPGLHRIKFTNIHRQGGQHPEVLRGDQEPEPEHSDCKRVDPCSTVAGKPVQPLLAALRLPDHQAMNNQQICGKHIARNVEWNTFVGVRTHGLVR